MPQYIQLDENNLVVATAITEQPPVHPNQYEVDNANALSGLVLHNGLFYPLKIVADTEKPGVSVELGDKVTG